jgi:hypothetical protein
MKNATSDAANTADTPTDAAIPPIIEPVQIPAAVAKATPLPFLSAEWSTSAVSRPGVIVRKAARIAYWRTASPSVIHRA